MFLSNPTASENFHFAEIYSCLQKSVRRGNIELCLELAKEFRDYPNALKKRLIYISVEDLPDWRLVYEIYKTPSTLIDLIKWIPIVCQHLKTRAGTDGYRYAVECPLNYYGESEYSLTDDIKTLLIKTAYKLKNNEQLNAVDWFEKYLKNNNFYRGYSKPTKIQTIYNFVNKPRTVLLGLCVYISIPEIRTYNQFDIKNVSVEEDFIKYNGYKWKLDLENYTLKQLPMYTYDKHVHGGNQSYDFFFKNMVLIPKIDTLIESYGVARYLESKEGANKALFTKDYFKTSTIYKYEFLKLTHEYEDVPIKSTLEETLQEGINEMEKI